MFLYFFPQKKSPINFPVRPDFMAVPRTLDNSPYVSNSILTFSRVSSNFQPLSFLIKYSFLTFQQSCLPGFQPGYQHCIHFRALISLFFAPSFSSCESLSCDVQIFQGEMIFAILRRFFLLDKFKRILTKTICTTTPPAIRLTYPKGFVRKRRAVFIKNTHIDIK